MRTFTRTPRYTRAQNALLNPVTFSSEKAEVISVTGEGLTRDAVGVDLITVIARVAERPGQPVRLTAKDTLAQKLAQIAKEGSVFAFEGNVSGNPVPYVFATSLEIL